VKQYTGGEHQAQLETTIVLKIQSKTPIQELFVSLSFIAAKV